MVGLNPWEHVDHAEDSQEDREDFTSDDYDPTEGPTGLAAFYSARYV